ncbi:uncharacterized protein N7459_004420 [Penicillium hispanicum]|uniref:uncharacterized protein n=1 Tax=Penicillium hispanicum TaxID=1080232 RepID=UPI00253F82B2|nr:uncharacterized protein N7459_004420 [Penicillium hispanicum]KAJ5584620.1 hypothetical protein N7459_004420 [Penicillium hispanicum]
MALVIAGFQNAQNAQTDVQGTIKLALILRSSRTSGCSDALDQLAEGDDLVDQPPLTLELLLVTYLRLFRHAGGDPVEGHCMGSWIRADGVHGVNVSLFAGPPRFSPPVCLALRRWQCAEVLGMEAEAAIGPGATWLKGMDYNPRN